MKLQYLAVITCLLTIAGCGESKITIESGNMTSSGASTNPSIGANASSTDTPASRGTIGVSVLTLDNPFFKVIADSITNAAAEQGYDTLVVSGDKDVAKQDKQVKDFIVREVAAIVLCPCDSKSIGPVIKECNDAGIPVFTTDIACLAPGVQVECHIATDNLGGGREAGRAMIEALGDAGGPVVVIDFKQAESCLLRVQGFKEVIDDFNKDRTEGRIEVVAELPGGGAKDQGYKAMEDALQAHPNVVGVFAINDPSALGARAALEKAGKADAVRIVGFDGQPEGKQAIKDGKIYADPIQFPDKMGMQTVDAILKHLGGEPVESEILIPTALYRQSDGQQDASLQ